jgi:ATP-dependent Clp protease ATP-binding subunit ClpA
LLFGKLVHGGSVKVALVDGQLGFEYTAAPPPAQAKPENDSDEGGTELEPEVAE